MTNLPVISEEEELAAVFRAFAEHPQAVVLADLFSEACRDENPSASDDSADTSWLSPSGTPASPRSRPTRLETAGADERRPVP